MAKSGHTSEDPEKLGDPLPPPQHCYSFITEREGLIFIAHDSNTANIHI